MAGPRLTFGLLYLDGCNYLVKKPSGTSGFLAFAFHEFREVLASEHYASLVLGTTHEDHFGRLPGPGLPRIHAVQTFLRLSARLAQLVSRPFLLLQDCSVSYPGFSELAHSACFFLQTFADCGPLDQILLSALAMDPDDEPFDLDAYLVELNLPDTFTKAWVAVNVGSHVKEDISSKTQRLQHLGVALRLPPCLHGHLTI